MLVISGVVLDCIFKSVYPVMFVNGLKIIIVVKM